MKEPHDEWMQAALSRDLAANVECFRVILNADVNADAKFRHFTAGGTRVCVVYMEGMASDAKISDFILRAMAEHVSATRASAGWLMTRAVESAQCDLERDVAKIVRAVATGMTAVLVDGDDAALVLETRGFPARSVEKPTNETVVLGAQEGFVECLRTNLTLVRRYVPSPHLVAEALTLGAAVPCAAALVYMDGVASPEVVGALRERLERIDLNYVSGAGAVQQCIEDKPGALLPQFLQTERPDRVAACLMEGQAAVLVDNSPYAIVAPVSLFHLLHASDDTFSRWQYGTFLRIIRLMGMLVSVFLPGLYIALTDYHMHLIPMSLLTSIAEARANVPFPVVTEILLMEFSFYLINEAGTRMPRQIGSALGIVGALILGQAAVAASIISPILVIIVALTGLGNYVTPDYSVGLGLVLYRLGVLLAGALFGLYGICVAAFCILAGLCGMRSLGMPFLAPVSPRRPHNPDILARWPIGLQHRLMYWARRPSWIEGERP